MVEGKTMTAAEIAAEQKKAAAATIKKETKKKEAVAKRIEKTKTVTVKDLNVLGKISPKKEEA